MDEYMNFNKAWWDSLVPIHAKSAFYDVEGFKAGKLHLHSLEIEEVGDVSGKTLLHLQCHLGIDTLSWARLGAKVTGVDFSDKAVAFAQSLSKELHLEANFVCSDIYAVSNILLNKFDVIFTSGGVLSWLPNLQLWAEIIAFYLKSGGILYIREEHPIKNIFDNEHSGALKVIHSYFSAESIKDDGKSTWADPTAKIDCPKIYKWHHSLSAILNSLISAGLKVEFLHEFPFSGWPCFPNMIQGEDRFWRLKEQEAEIPLMFSIRATKEE
jgi:SAM-dependent methyltransferase